MATTKKTILIVEDEKSLRDAVADVLHSKGFFILEAKNGKEGVKLALGKHPDLVLLDLIMPTMDGMETFQKIRGDEWGKSVPIIILTNLNTKNEQLANDEAAHKPTHILIKSDWKLHDIVRKIEEVLKI